MLGAGGGGGHRVRHPFGPASVGGGLPYFLVPNREPAHSLQPRFVVAEFWANGERGGGGGTRGDEGILPLTSIVIFQLCRENYRNYAGL